MASITSDEIERVAAQLEGGELGARVVQILEAHEVLARLLEEARAKLRAEVGTFQWAVAQKRPMRRTAWLHHKPLGDEKDQERASRLLAAYWVFLRVIPTTTTDSMWLRLSDGVVHRLQLDDYLATDWEVM
jgi:hypothetical protein